MRNWVFFSVLLFLISPLMANGEIWEVKIPSGAADPTIPSHFLPKEITVRINDFVEWKNGDVVDHTVTSGTLETGTDGRFDSKHLKAGEKFTQQFTENHTGENKYFCTLHPWLTGIINVADIEDGFQVIHNVGSDVSETTFDVHYKVKRNLVNAVVDPIRNSIIFNFAGKIQNDNFVVNLPKPLIENVQGVWVDDKEITNFKSSQLDNLSILDIPLDGDTEQVKIVGTKVIGKIKPKPLLLINQILTIPNKKTYFPSDEITISGEVKNPTQLFHVTIQIVSPNQVTLYSEDIPLQNDYKFTTKVKAKDTLIEFGTYKIKIIGKDTKTTVIPFDYKMKPTEQLSPKKQMEMKTSPKDITCNEELKLMKKVSNNAPICVRESTEKILLERGWATYFS